MLSTNNIRLRKIEPQDIPFLYIVENQSTEWGSQELHNPISKKDLIDYVNSSTADIYQDRQLRLIIESNDSNSQTIGVIDLYDLDIFNQKVAIGIYIDQPYRQNGFAKDAVNLLTHYVFDILGLRMIYCFVAQNNLPSLKLFTSCQFQNVATIPEFLKNDSVVVCSRINTRLT